MARAPNSPDSRVVLPSSTRWALVGYVLPAILIGSVLLLIQGAPLTAQPYNYGLLFLLTVLLSATIAVICLVVAVVLAVQALRRKPIELKWPHYVALAASCVPFVVSAVWFSQF